MLALTTALTTALTAAGTGQQTLPPALVMAALWPLLYVAHTVGDHWVQTDAQAVTKAKPGWDGRSACARHTAVMVGLQGAALAAGVLLLGLGLSPVRAALALAVTAVTHYAADRRAPLARLAGATGKARFWALGDGFTAPAGTGAYALDQAWHHAWLLVSVLILAV